MTSKQLIENALRRKSSGGIMPVHFSFADANVEKSFAEYMGMTSDELKSWLDNDLKNIYPIEDIQSYAMSGGALQLAKELGFAKESPDIKKAMVDQYGCTWATETIGQELLKGSIEDIEEVYSFEFPKSDPKGLHGIKEWIEKWEEKNYATVVHQNFNIFERAWAMVGYEDFMVACYSNTDEVEYLLDRLTEIKIQTAENICALHPTAGHTGDDFGLQSGGIMSLEMFRKLFKPRYKKIWDVYKKHGIPIIHHSCGDCSMYLEDMIEIGLDMLNPVQQSAMDINMMAERFGDSLSFFGSIDTINVLTKGTPDDVRRNVDATAEILGKNNGLLLSMLNIMPETPHENIKAGIEQMMKYRTGPRPEEYPR